MIQYTTNSYVLIYNQIFMHLYINHDLDEMRQDNML